MRKLNGDEEIIPLHRLFELVGRFEGDAGKPTVLYIDSPRPDDELQAFRRALSEVARG